jgi:hypothetical protein
MVDAQLAECLDLATVRRANAKHGHEVSLPFVMKSAVCEQRGYQAPGCKSGSFQIAWIRAPIDCASVNQTSWCMPFAAL